MNIREFKPITKMMDEGVQHEIDRETEIWNTRQWKGTVVDRYPLSPSQIGKCGLALARNLSHYVGADEYPRSNNSISPRVKRIFARGHLLEGALIGDMEKFAGLKIESQQQRLKLFPLSAERSVEGSIDGIAVHPDGTRILVDYKSKGAFYSSGFQDSISQFFKELQQTGLVEELDENCFFITDAKALFDIISLDEFFVDYLLQLNSYAFGRDAETNEKVEVDFVSLYYENKNTCANYEVRWVPHAALFEYAQKKFKFIFDQTRASGAESVPKEFAFGSGRCRLCDYNEMCWGKYEPKSDAQKGRIVGSLPSELNDKIVKCLELAGSIGVRNEEDALKMMQDKDWSHIQLMNGLVYERKFLKSPKPHYELRLSK